MTPAQSGEPAPGRGRPRDVARGVAICRATRELLGEVGYDALSMEQIARRAGVSKATIYRRWSNKAELVTSAVQATPQAAGPPAPAGGSLREVLLEILGWFARGIVEHDVSTLAAILAGMRADADLAAAMRATLRRDEAAMIRHSLGAARERGVELVADADRLFVEIAPAMIVHRVLIVGEPCDERFLAHVVDDVLLPVLTPPT